MLVSHAPDFSIKKTKDAERNNDRVSVAEASH
jgi:hypothetical protein